MFGGQYAKTPAGTVTHIVHSERATYCQRSRTATGPVFDWQAVEIADQPFEGLPLCRGCARTAPLPETVQRAYWRFSAEEGARGHSPAIHPEE